MSGRDNKIRKEPESAAIFSGCDHALTGFVVAGCVVEGSVEKLRF
ncbi:hypothetical protein BBC0122_002600 [Bartonella choladocola]|uniref:Uncharacterized protein n=1 Tax=Bartonella choladocola TaxID=2750995 RepID=A0A1U9MF84_9HYPH|nr:hypothetical protein BBC0122_002600 [Bartonella choladocola]